MHRLKGGPGELDERGALNSKVIRGARKGPENFQTGTNHLKGTAASEYAARKGQEKLRKSCEPLERGPEIIRERSNLLERDESIREKGTDCSEGVREAEWQPEQARNSRERLQVFREKGGLLQRD